MGKQKKKQKKRGNPLWTLVFLAALAVFCFSGYKLIGIYLDYKTGKARSKPTSHSLRRHRTFLR